MWSTEYIAVADAEPEALWRLLSDVDGWGAWNDGIATIALDGPLAVGATFRMTPSGQDELISTVAELEPNRLFTDVTEAAGLVVRVQHLLDPRPAGGTTITYRIEVSGPDEVAAEVGGAVSADFPQVMAALAAAAGARTIPGR